MLHSITSSDRRAEKCLEETCDELGGTGIEEVCPALSPFRRSVWSRGRAVKRGINVTRRLLR